MNKYEKEMIKLIEAHEKAEKADLIRNMNRLIRKAGIFKRHKCKWLCKVTNAPIGTVNTWFCNAKCRLANKIPLRAMCQIAVALKVSVWEFFETEKDTLETIKAPIIDRRSKLYWHIRRTEAPNLWNEAHYGYEERWEHQSKEVQRDFLDMLYMEKMEQKKEEEQNG